VAVFLGHRGKDILWVAESAQPPVDSSLPILRVPRELWPVPPKIILTDYEVFKNTIMHRAAAKPPDQMRAAFVGVYDIPCGIATYSKWLWNEMLPSFEEAHIFAENGPGEPRQGVTRCWERGKPLDDLVAAIRAYNPDVVYIQHEYGIFPNARYWLAFLSALHSYKVIVTLHSVYLHHDKIVCEAAIPEIVVHTNAAAKCLIEKGISGKIHVINHGALPIEDHKPLWNIYGSSRTIIQFGFGFRYKGWESSLHAVAKLKEEFADVFFTGLFSENPFSKKMHELYFQELMGLVKELGIEGQVSIIRGYQSDLSLAAYLKTNRVAIFPYVPNGEHTVYGCSGAARLAMHYALPVVVSGVPLFDDLSEVCPRASDVESLCAEIRLLFHKEKAQAQIKKQNLFLETNSWKVASEKYLAIL